MLAVPNSKLELNVKYSYPYNPDYDYETCFDRINLDEECEKDLATGNGFIISSPKATIKKDIKDPDGIFSTRFGQKLGDMNPFADRYSCNCGKIQHRVNHGKWCSECKSYCHFVGDNFKLFGWIKLEEFHFIHPTMYRSIEYLCGPAKQDLEIKKQKGTKLKNMLYYNAAISQSGHIIGVVDQPPDEPFSGIGMIEFYNRFDEIMEYYVKKYPKKIEYYVDIMNDRDKVFAKSFPVFTTHLRPADIQDENMFFEPMNADYNMINILIHRINKNATKMQRDIKTKNQYLYKMQMKIMHLFDNVLDICKGKKGQFRMLVSGRHNFSSRAVIAQDPSLRIDQCRLPYAALVKMLELRITNIYMRLYNVSMAEASDVIMKAKTHKNERIAAIIDSIIKNTTSEGLPIILNRNPTINYGSIMQLFCIGYTDDLTIRVPLQILPPLAADFDGDSLNVFMIINKIFFQRCYEIFNPRNAMYISRNDGMTNASVLVQRDTITNANTLIHLSRDNYTEEELNQIHTIMEAQKKFFEAGGY